MNAEDWIGCCAGKTTEMLFEDLRRLHRVEAQMLAPILAHLSEIDKRGAAIAAAFPSLFIYCIRELYYSEGEAFLRIRAARAARRFPRILGMIARREIHITAAAMIAPHLTPENYRSLLGKAGRRTKEELQRLIAELAPQPEARPVIRTLSVGIRAAPAASTPEGGSYLALSGDASAQGAGSGVAQNDLFETCQPVEVVVSRSESAAGKTLPQPPDVGAMPQALEPTARVLFNFVGDESLLKKFKRAREILWHKYPKGRPDRIFEEALDALLDRKDPERRIARKLRRKGIGRRKPEVLL